MNYLFQRIFLFSFLISVPTLSLAQMQNTAAVAGGSNDSSADLTRYIRSWRGDSSDLQQKVNALDTVSTQSVYVPVLFGVEPKDIYANFGDPRSNGRTHIGQDIMAVKGTPIVSPTAAVVLRTGVGTGEGNYVYTANPGGETFVYMHLDTFGEGILAGSILEKGSLIGYVGNTGNASGGAAHLHFEIHDNNGNPMDPFPRLTGVFSLQEKMQHLSKILTQTVDVNVLSQLLVVNFRSTFNAAIASNIVLPQVITNYLASVMSSPQVLGSTLPTGDLALGSKGSEVVRLQDFLIQKNVGPAAVRLTQASATGSFGPITQAALIEYQIRVKITPADGYYGFATRAAVETNQGTGLPTVTPSPDATSSPMMLTRNLYKGFVGEDVQILQKFLNTHGYIVAPSGPGSLGSETNLFGNATEAAIVRFQINNQISPAVGYVGPLTRAKLNSLTVQ